jgi:hypothetical protein
MKGLLAIVILGGAIAQHANANGQAQNALAPAELKSALGTASIPSIPPPPKGKSTIMGGQIQRIDPVRDELTLKVYGERPVKILFDERTLVFKDGKKLPLRELGAADHASVQTLLDGTKVYALSVHILTSSPQGEYQGTVQSYNPATNQLTMNSVLFKEPIKLVVPPGTQVTRVGQTAFASQQASASDLARGALISVQFGSDNAGQGVASRISVLATPGSAFVFIGAIDSLDAHSGKMAIVDAQDGRTYQVSFDAASLPNAQSLHPGDNVMVTAAYSGDHYVASAINVNK